MSCMDKSGRSGRDFWRAGSPPALFLVVSLAVAATPLVADDDVDSFSDVVKKGTVELSLRYRAEVVEDDAFERDAFASTLRTTLKLATARWRGARVVLEAEDVRVLGDEDGYRNAGAGSLSNGVTDRPVVADPEITEVNQAYVEWEGPVALRIGRQEMNLGDQRFVGAVGWRQNHQSFDAARVDWAGSGRVSLTYAYLERAHRIFGSDFDLDSHLVWVPVELGSAGTLTAYGLVFDNEGAVESSTRTLGLEWTGSVPVADGWKLLWEAEVARQEDHGDRVSDLDVGYAHAVAGFETRGVRVSAGLEILEGEPGEGAFSTPLATLHKWNGWADRFLATPPDGLEDLAITASGPAGPVRWVLAFHEFSAESTSVDYGSEIDAQISWKAKTGTALALKAALYDADGFSEDVTKLWFQASHSF